MQLKHELEEAVEGLLYPSDDEAPFEVAIHACAGAGPVQPSRFLELLGLPADRPIEQQEARTFFEELEFSPGFQRLYAFLRERLQHLQVFRVGRVRVAVYVVGRTPEGALAVLSTQSLET